MNIFKNIPNRPGYLVSNTGVVLSERRGSTQTLKPFRCGKDRNYLKVRLYNGEGFQDMLVHRIVALTFLANPENLPFINHKDEDTFNNHLDNLEWCTSQYNKIYSSGRTLTLINPEGEPITRSSVSAFCHEFKLSNGSLYHLLSGKYSHHKGWTLTSS